ncbi:hypothetical protein [Variovorax boronicumulans]|uniref:hypothetical protein n=1 Tax=Variovorax boronicumulans TaxID=436515 RepID=UPI00339B5E5A
MPLQLVDSWSDLHFCNDRARFRLLFASNMKFTNSYFDAINVAGTKQKLPTPTSACVFSRWAVAKRNGQRARHWLPLAIGYFQIS